MPRFGWIRASLDAGEAANHHSDVSAQVTSWLPGWAQTALAWLLQPVVLAILLGASALLFVLSLIGLPMFLTRMPVDFFSRPERRRLKLSERKRPFWFVVLRGLKNTLGARWLPPAQPTPSTRVRSVAVLGGLHHEYGVLPVAA